MAIVAVSTNAPAARYNDLFISTSPYVSNNILAEMANVRNAQGWGQTDQGQMNAGMAVWMSVPGPGCVETAKLI